MSDIIKFPARTYTAKLFEIGGFSVAGTLDGYVDLATSVWTFQIEKSEAIAIAKALLACVDDINENCLYDKDILLERHV